MKAPSNSEIERLLSDPAIRAQFDAQHREPAATGVGERTIKLEVGGRVVLLRSSPVKVP